MITLYQFEISPFCDKVRRMLHYKGQPYTVREVPISANALGAPRVSPVGKVPCIEHDGRVIADSTNIALHLEAVFPDPPLFPADPKLRGLCHMLEDWADESLYFFEYYLRFVVPENARRWIPVLLRSDNVLMRTLGPLVVPIAARRHVATQGLGRKPYEMIIDDLQRHVTSISDWLADSEWLVGDALSVADLSVYTQLYCIRGAREGERIIGSADAVVRWMQRVEAATDPPQGQ